MKQLLKLKHWQLFLLLSAIPLAFLFTINNTPVMEILFPIMVVLCMGLWFIWFYSMGINLYKKLPATVSMNISLFKIAIFIPFVYMLFVSVFMYGMFPFIYS